MEWITILLVLCFCLSSNVLAPAISSQLSFADHLEQEKCVFTNNSLKLRFNHTSNLGLLMDLYCHGTAPPKTVVDCPATEPCRCGYSPNCNVSNSEGFVEVMILNGQQSQPEKVVITLNGTVVVQVNCTYASNGVHSDISSTQELPHKPQEEPEGKQTNYGVTVGVPISLIVVACVAVIVVFRKEIKDFCVSGPKDVHQDWTHSSVNIQLSTAQAALESSGCDLQTLGITQVPEAEPFLANETSDQEAEMDLPRNISTEAEVMTAPSRAVAAQPEGQNATGLPICERDHDVDSANGVIESSGALTSRDKHLLICSPERNASSGQAKRGNCRKQ